MDSRQRVVTALRHQEPDRLPWDCTFSFGACQKLIEHLGLSPQNQVRPSGPGLNVSPPPELLQDLQIDLCYVGLNTAKSTPQFEYGAETYTDEWGARYRKIANSSGLYYELVDHPLASATLRDLEDYAWPDPNDPALTEGLESKCRELYERTGFALVGKFSSSIFEQAFSLRGLEQWLIDLATDPEFAEALMDRLTEHAICLTRRGLEACGKYLQILRLAGDDMGHQQGTIVSPGMFRRLIKPRFHRLYRAAKTMFLEYNPTGRIMAHTDGDVYPIIQDYIEMGLDVLNPVQPYVAEMDHGRLKKEFGSRLSFHGGMDMQRVLPFGSPSEVKAEVRNLARDLGPMGGYILAPTHYVQPDVPPQNIIAMRDAVFDLGRYPL